MSNGLISALGSLIGVIVGALTSFLSQDRHWKRETRRQVYGTYVGKAITWLDALFRVAFTIREEWNPRERAPWWDHANEARVEVAALLGQVGMLANRSTRDRAMAMDAYLQNLHDEIFKHEMSSTVPNSDEMHRGTFHKLLEQFIAEAGRELRISRRAP
jgi:hypothetical protein